MKLYILTYEDAYDQTEEIMGIYSTIENAKYKAQNSNRIMLYAGVKLKWSNHSGMTICNMEDQCYKIKEYEVDK